MIKQHMRKLFVLSILCIAALSLIIGCRPFGGSNSDDGVGPVITEPQIPVSLSQVEDAIQEAIKKDPEVAWQPEITTFVQNVQKEEIAALLGSNDSAPPTQDQIQELVQTDFFKEVEVNEAVDPDQLFSMDAQEDFSNRFDPAFSVRKSVRGSYYLPPRINWVDKDGKNFVTPVKSQGQYGTCAAFASTATLESNLKIAFGDPTFDFDLSEAWLWFYGTGKFPVPSRPKPTPPLLGGWQNYLAFFFLLPRNGYIISESEAPYSLLQLFPEFGKISENANRYNVNGIFSLRSATAMKLALQKGPVAAIMRTNAYIFYYGPNSGIYSYIPIYDANGKELKFPDQPDSSPGAHAITVVGYDDGQGCWICKNSWGSDWGENGFFRARYGKSILEDSGFLISVPVMINERSPGAQQTEVPVNSSVVIKFGEKLRAETVTNKAFKLERLPDNQVVSFAASYHSVSQTVVLKPSAPLAMASSYRVTATTDVRSSDGDSLLQNDTWVFYTEGFSEKVNPRAEFIRRPESISGSKKALFEIGGYKIDAFRYKLDNEAWSEEFPADRIVELQNLSDGQHVVRVIGRSGSIWQSESEVTSWPWQINSSVSIGYFAYGPDAVTSNSKPDFSFKADDMTAVKLKLNDFGWTSWIPVVNNEYLFGFTGEINTIGTHTLLAVARNSLGVEQPIESAAKWQWVYDPAFNSNAVLLAQPALEGTFTTARFEVGGDKIVAYKYLVDAQTAFSAEFPVSTPIQLVDLKPGDHLIKVLGKTDGGVWQATDKPTTYAWKILPMPELKFVLTPPAINSVDRIGFIIDGQGYTAFKYKLGNQNWSSETPQTSFEFKNLSAIGITGRQTFRVVGRTVDGNWLSEAQAASFTWLQDISIPVKAEFAELPAQITSSTSAVFKVTGERLTRWAYVLDGNPYVMALASESANLSSLTAGYHTLYIIGRDWSGKWQGWENAASFTWLIDVEPPTAMFVNKPVSITNQTGFELKVGGAGVVSYRYQLNGGSWSESLPVTQSATISNLKSGKQMLSIIGADAAGNWQSETAANMAEWSVDLEKPVITISSAVKDPASFTSIPVRVEFSKEVNGFEISDLQVENGVAGNLVILENGKTFSVDITPRDNGLVKVTLAADKVVDIAGNSNGAASFSISSDQIRPMVDLRPSSTETVDGKPVVVTFVFSEPVYELNIEDIEIINGWATNLEVVSNTVFNAEITPLALGNVKILLPEGACYDQAGNKNVSSADLLVVNKTSVIPLASINAVNGLPQSGQTLTAGALTPVDATVDYKWQISDNGTDGWVDIAGATANTYVVDLAKTAVGKYVRVVATGKTNFSGTVNSNAVQIGAVPVTAIAATSGTPQSGQTLTAGALTPVDATVDYKWQISDNGTDGWVDIAGATANTYVVDLAKTATGKYVRVVATGKTNFSGTVNSNAVQIGAAPVTAIAATSGTPQSGQILTAGALTPNDATVDYKWQVSDSSTDGWVDIAGATANTYVVDLAKTAVGKYVRVVATGKTNFSGTVNSNAVQIGAAPVTAIVATSGTPQSGQTLTAGALTPVDATVDYKWQISDNGTDGWVDIAGATANTYVVDLAKTAVGKYVRVVATGKTNFSGTVNSNAVQIGAAPVTAIAATSGTPQSGQILTAGALTPNDATVDYKWQVSDSGTDGWVDIAGATANTYVVDLAKTAVGKYVRVVATGKNNYSGAVNCEAVKILTSVTAIEAMSGIPMSGQTLTAGALTPADSTVDYKWQVSDDGLTGWTEIAGATTNTYVVDLAKTALGKYVRVTATGNSNFGGIVNSMAEKIQGMPTMISVPAGTFQRDATPTNTSFVSAFTMSAHEITRAQFARLMGIDPSDTAYSSGLADPAQKMNWYHAIAFCNKLSLAEGLTPVYAVNGVDFSTLTYAEIPIVSSNADWNAVTCNWSGNGYRLPTEMEWVWAAMGADQDSQPAAMSGGVNVSGYAKNFAGYNGSNSLDAYSWYMNNSSSKTHPVGAQNANELGLYDMSGNVSEWCWDSYGIYPEGSNTNYTGAAADYDHVLRGGSWSDFSGNISFTYRNYDFLNTGFFDCGFRVVRSVVTPVTAIGAMSGIPMSGQTLTAGLLSPADATVDYKWQVSDDGLNAWNEIVGATTNSYVVDLAKTAIGKYVRVTVTGNGNFGGIVNSAAEKIQGMPMMVSVPAGTFQRDASAANTSFVSSFSMSAHEITRAQFAKLMGTDSVIVVNSDGNADPMRMVNWYQAITFCNKLSLAEGLTPVYAVSGVDFSTLTYAAIPNGARNANWDAATCNWLANGYRLPTEMEWMWAAMGANQDSQPGAMVGGINVTGYTKTFAGYNGSNSIDAYVWYLTNSGNKIHPVSTKLANELGLYDMNGNLWEWCWDWSDNYPAGSNSDYRGAETVSYRVKRGGCASDSSGSVTVARREDSEQASQSGGLGFRVVRP